MADAEGKWLRYTALPGDGVQQGTDYVILFLTVLWKGKKGKKLCFRLDRSILHSCRFHEIYTQAGFQDFWASDFAKGLKIILEVQLMPSKGKSGLFSFGTLLFSHAFYMFGEIPLWSRGD